MAETIYTRYFTPLQRVTRVETIDRGVLLTVDTEQLRVEAIRDDIVRLKLSRGGTFDESATFAVVPDLDSCQPKVRVR